VPPVTLCHVYIEVRKVFWNQIVCYIIFETPLYNLPFLLYGCETWSLTLNEEQRLRVFKNRVLRKIYVAKEEDIMGG
jgi:hypothetical protein